MPFQHTNISDITALSKEKIFVIGLDGATFDLIKPWVNEGKLPNLAKILKEGTYGDLRSTIPTNSAPAWTSFVTGTNPGKHGILHFKPLGYQTKDYLLNRNARGCKAVWNILSENGKKVGIINVPMTYPPEKVNGFMISGIDTPSRKSTFTSPERLYKEIKEAVGDYEIEAQLADLVRIRNDRERQRFIKAVMNTVELRFRATKYLMEKYDWDFFLLVFTATDRFQHRFWKFMDKNHPHYDFKDSKRYGNVIFDAYKRLDEIVGELSDILDDDTTLIIMSDHGFGPAPVKYIKMNSWLASKGLLTFNKKRYAGKGFNLQSLILNKLQLYMPIKLRHYLRVKFRSKLDKMQLASRLPDIDWSITRAYADQHVEVFSNIWINLKGREPHGTVDPGEQFENIRNHIIGILKDIRDPENREFIVKNVYKREDLYKGPSNHKTPDIIVEWKNNGYRTHSSFASSRDSVDTYFGIVDQRETSLTLSGEHEENGIFIMRGNGIKTGKEIYGSNITDLAPTILYKLGIRIPIEMDGKVLTDAFENEYMKDREIEYDKTSSFFYRDRETHTFSLEENQKVQDRLRSLGYLE